MAVAPDVKSLQQLLITFESWCAWTKMTIRLDKCVAYASQKRNGIYVQYKPNLSLLGGYIPTVEIGGHFTYLGKIFNFKNNENVAKELLQKKLQNMLEITDSLKIKVQDKIKIVALYIQNQIMFDLKIYKFGLTWVDHTLDALCFKYMRVWLELPISACLREIYSLSKSRGGLGIHSFKSSQKECA